MTDPIETVPYTCSFVPCELIAACGLRPKRIAPRSGAVDLVGSTAGLCTYAQAFVNSICAEPGSKAIILTTLCDQMRRAGELIAQINEVPVFLMNVPSTWQGESVWELYLDELRRLGDFLAALGAKTPSDAELAEVMLEYDTLRSKLRQCGEFLSAREYSQAVRAIHRREAPVLEGSGRGPVGESVALAVVGGELLHEDLAIFDRIENAGGRVVLDATDSGQRSLPAPFDRRQVRSGPLMQLAEAYFGAIPHAFRRPNSELYRYLNDELTARDVCGIVFRRYQWCDIWNAELQRLRDWTSMPVLDLDMGGEGDNSVRLDGRIQAFMETLR